MSRIWVIEEWDGRWKPTFWVHRTKAEAELGCRGWRADFPERRFRVVAYLRGTEES